MTRMKKVFAGMILLVTLGLGVQGLAWARDSGEWHADGQVPTGFSLTQLHDRNDTVRLDRLRRATFEECMEQKGFTAAPTLPDEGATATQRTYAGAYSEAANGDDGSLTEAPAHSVKLPDGTTSTVYLTWTPSSCMYQSFASLGSDPFEREALRQKIQEMRVRAEIDAGNDPELNGVLGEWQSCVGSEGDPTELLAALDGTNGSPYSDVQTARQACITPAIRERATAVRAEHHYAAADKSRVLVDAWIELVDAEIEASRT